MLMVMVIYQTYEVETSTRKKETYKYKKIEYAKANNAILVVAKLDRLARDVSFTSAI
jgi:DNA invertase Pin-like site-specific DNA recombinase